MWLYLHPNNPHLTNQLQIFGSSEMVRENVCNWGLFILMSNVKIITRSIKTSIFCSAKRLAMHDRIPWLNGSTRYGLMFDLVDFWSFFSHRSGMNLSAFSKCFAKRHDIKFCVTVIVWNIENEWDSWASQFEQELSGI